MGYLASRNSNQIANVNLLIDTMRAKGITNPYSQAAILSIISKESGFSPSPESDYSRTGNARIREIFSITRSMSDNQLNALKANPKAFFDTVYGGRYGNAPDEGYKYRGRGFNQVTFKANYQALSSAVGVDLVSNPEKLSDPKTAADVAIEYFKRKFKNEYSATHQAAYKSKDIDSFTSISDSTLAFYHANAGFGKPIYTTNTTTSTGGLELALSRAPEFLNYVQLYSKKKE